MECYEKKQFLEKFKNVGQPTSSFNGNCLSRFFWVVFSITLLTWNFANTSFSPFFGTPNADFGAIVSLLGCYRLPLRKLKTGGFQ